jgi:hypothetical protein
MRYSVAKLKIHFQEQSTPNTHFLKQFQEAIKKFETHYPDALSGVVTLKKFIPCNERSIPAIYEPLVKSLAYYLDIKHYPTEALVYETNRVVNTYALIGWDRDNSLFEIIYNHITQSLDDISYKILNDKQKERTNQRRQSQRKGNKPDKLIKPYTFASQYKIKTVESICKILADLLAIRKQTPYYKQIEIIHKLSSILIAYESTRPYTT